MICSCFSFETKIFLKTRLISVEHLQLQEGKQAIAMIKASDVIIATE
ncbi:TOBE domain-containing protein [Nostoc sp.]